MADTQAAWFAQLMAPGGENEVVEDGGALHHAVADACIVKRADTERIVRELATGTRISPAAITTLAAVADYVVRKALNVRTKKIAALNMGAVPEPLRPLAVRPQPVGVQKGRSRSKPRA